MSDNNKFNIQSPFSHRGDQPNAIEKLVRGVNDGLRFQTLLGVTGSGKTFTMAGIIEELQKPTLVIAHNKTLAAQLASELQEFFPNNSVQYFFLIMITINLKLMFLELIHILKKSQI